MQQQRKSILEHYSHHSDCDRQDCGSNSIHYFWMRFIFIPATVLIIFLPFITFSQNKKDSLIALINQTPKDTNRVKLLIETGKEYLDFNLDSADFFFSDAYKISKILNFKYGQSESLIQLAYVNQCKNFTEIAIDKYLKSVEILSELNDSAKLALIYNRLGNRYQELGNLNISMSYYTKSLKIRQKIKDKKGESSCLNNIGLILEQQGKDSLALYYYQKSLKISEEIGDKSSVSLCLINIGGLLHRTQNYDEATKYYEKALSIYQELNDIQGQYESLINIGLVNNIRKEFDSSIDNFNKALKLAQSLNDQFIIANCYTNLGVAYGDKNELDQSEYYFKKSAELYKTIDHPEGISRSLINLALNSYERKKYNNAIDLNKKALSISTEIESKELMRHSYKGLYENYYAIKDYKNALDNYIRYKDITDSIYNIDNAKKITQMDMQYQFEQQQRHKEIEQVKKDAEQKAKLDRQRIYTLLFIVGFVLMIALALVVYRSNRQKQKDNILLTKQKEEINIQKEQITGQLQTITHQKNEITSSIHYAERIQHAILPPVDIIKKYLPEHFIFFHPRDIVSGDFYWFTNISDADQNKFIITAADCTGHGVPGAFMSMLGISFLNEIVKKNNITDAHQILNHLRSSIKTALRQTGKETDQKDGMDISLCVIDSNAKKIQWAGANNPLYYIHNNQLIEYKADRMPIGVHIKEKESFTLNEINYEEGDMAYIFSDGFQDQFGGDSGKKFMSKNFKSLLLEIYHQDCQEQEAKLLETMNLWIGAQHTQIDDQLIIGFKLITVR